MNLLLDHHQTEGRKRRLNGHRNQSTLVVACYLEFGFLRWSLQNIAILLCPCRVLQYPMVQSEIFLLIPMSLDLSG